MNCFQAPVHLIVKRYPVFPNPVFVKKGTPEPNDISIAFGPRSVLSTGLLKAELGDRIWSPTQFPHWWNWTQADLPVLMSSHITT
jgi:hypothetical protein